jgi:hypothetical protein
MEPNLRVLIENPLASKAAWKNNLSITSIAHFYTLASIFYWGYPVI